MKRQARQESNPQPTVLETVALPVELLACNNALTLFPMGGVFATARAVLFQRDPAAIVLAVLLACIVPFLALGAGKRDNDPIFFLGHFDSSPTPDGAGWGLLPPTNSFPN